MHVSRQITSAASIIICLALPIDKLLVACRFIRLPGDDHQVVGILSLNSRALLTNILVYLSDPLVIENKMA